MNEQEKYYKMINEELFEHFRKLITKYNLDWKDQIQILQKLTQSVKDENQLHGNLTIIAK